MRCGDEDECGVEKQFWDDCHLLGNSSSATMLDMQIRGLAKVDDLWPGVTKSPKNVAFRLLSQHHPTQLICGEKLCDSRVAAATAARDEEDDDDVLKRSILFPPIFVIFSSSSSSSALLLPILFLPKTWKDGRNTEAAATATARGRPRQVREIIKYVFRNIAVTQTAKVMPSIVHADMFVENYDTELTKFECCR